MDKNKLNYFNFSQNILVLILLTSFWGAVVYRFYALNWFGVIISLILVIITYCILHYFFDKFNPPLLKLPPSLKLWWTSRRTSPLSWLKMTWGHYYEDQTKIRWLLPFYAILVVIDLVILLQNSTSRSIISPWETLPSYFFFLYFLATFLLLIILSFGKKYQTVLLLIHLFLSLSVIWLVYRLGYGYDFFVHNATLELISEKGMVLPKPNYYLGHYSLIIILHKIFGLSIHWLNLLVVPILAAVFLPITLVNLFRNKFKEEYASLSIPFLLIIPFSFLTFSTPQNFAYLLLLLMIIYGLDWQNIKNYLIIGLLSVTSLVIHPIVGLPALFFFILITFFRYDFKFKKYLSGAVFILTAVALPLSFYFLERSSLDFSGFSFKKLIHLPILVIPIQDSVILNIVYLYGFNFGLIISLLIVVGIVIYFKKKNSYSDYTPYLIIAPALLLSYSLTRLLPFNYLINYERSDFAERILVVAVIFFLPFVFLAFVEWAKRIMEQEKYVRICWLLIISLGMSFSFYLSYPRYDQFFNSHGYSVGNFDLEAVKFIDDNSKADYIVLANQQVSAAALSQFGFDRYYKEQIFYYPVPTSGPLYKFYLDMVYKKPNRETMTKAMDLAGVNEAYFVLNKYWYASPKIVEEAKLEADSWQKIGTGEIYIFRYGR